MVVSAMCTASAATLFEAWGNGAYQRASPSPTDPTSSPSPRERREYSLAGARGDDGMMDGVETDVRRKLRKIAIELRFASG